jgi:hypothetical protein
LVVAFPTLAAPGEFSLSLMGAPNADGVHVVRDGVEFHHAKTRTAEDVVWNWNRSMDPATHWTLLGD